MLHWRSNSRRHIAETSARQPLRAWIHRDQLAGNAIFFNVGAESSGHDARAISRTDLDNAARFPMPHHAICDFCIARFEVTVSVVVRTLDRPRIKLVLGGVEIEKIA